MLTLEIFLMLGVHPNYLKFLLSKEIENSHLNSQSIHPIDKENNRLFRSIIDQQ